MKVYLNWDGGGWSVWSDEGHLFDISSDVGHALGVNGDAVTGELEFKQIGKGTPTPHPEVLRQVLEGHDAGP